MGRHRVDVEGVEDGEGRDRLLSGILSYFWYQSKNLLVSNQESHWYQTKNFLVFVLNKEFIWYQTKDSLWGGTGLTSRAWKMARVATGSVAEISDPIYISIYIYIHACISIYIYIYIYVH